MLITFSTFFSDYVKLYLTRIMCGGLALLVSLELIVTSAMVVLISYYPVRARPKIEDSIYVL